MLNQRVRDVWNANAAFWDTHMGHEGNSYQRLLVGPAQERLLQLRPNELVLDVACGNGLFSRRMADLGCRVIACDIAEQMVQFARKRNPSYAGRIDYQVVDATDERQLLALGERRFDAAVCGMAIMDMPEVRPLFSAVARLLKPGRPFVFSVVHPCFNYTDVVRMSEQLVEGNEVVTRHFLKLPASYITPATRRSIAVSGQPEVQYNFDRPLSALLGAAFDAGFVVDGMREPVFPPDVDGGASAPGDLFQQIPPVLVVRTRRLG